MAIKKVESIQPTHYKVDKLGRKIPVYRGGIRDTNKHANKTPFEREIDRNMNNDKYKPSDTFNPGKDKP